MRKHIETYRGAVATWQCDHMGHMNTMWYVGKFEESSWNLLTEAGLGPSYVRGSHGMVGVHQDITYKCELHAGDVVGIRSRVIEVRDKSVRHVHEMINLETSEVAAVFEATAVHIDATTRKACSFPPKIRERLRQMITD